jgi:DNA-3-methyladenine glycosylase II
MAYAPPAYWEEGKLALAARDKTLKSIINSYHGETLALRGAPFVTLCRSIAGQQISVKAADSVWNRLAQGLADITPNVIADTPASTLRGFGLSERKALYLHALASHFLENGKLIKQWPKLSDDDVIAELTSIKGIGRWTAEMFLIFGLGRPDVFPVDDLGLIKGLNRHYSGGKPLSQKKILAIGESWRPYRSIGTWYMWRALDPVAVAY